MKLKDGYKKLIGTSYNGDISLILLSNGGNLGYDISSTANTLVLRNANGLIESSLATGTAPLKVASTTLVENLNADLLDGLQPSELSVLSASKLTTARTLWGQSFDGTANVSGNMTGVRNITITSGGNVDRFITFDTASTRSWRIGYLGTGSGDANYLAFQSTKTLTAADGWHDMLKIGCETGNATFTGQVIASNFVSGEGINDFSAGIVKLTTLNIPTTSGGTTYGAGTNGLVLKSNGTTVYWASDSNSNTWRNIKVNGTQIAGTGTGTYSVDYLSGDGINITGVAGTSTTKNNTITITNTGVRSVTIGTGDNANKIAVNTGGTTTYLTIPYATHSTHLIGGALGSIPYQSAADTTTFLAAPTTNGYVLKYNITDKKPYWAADSNNKVTQTITTTNANYRVLFSTTADDTTRTETARKATNLLFNPSSGLLTAGGFVKSGYDDTYVLLAGGGHKALSELGGTISLVYIWGLPFNGTANVDGTVISNTSKTKYECNYNYYYMGAKIMANDLASGDNLEYVIGRNYSTKNIGYFGYHQGATDNDTYLRIGFHSVDDILSISTLGRVGINTTTPAYTLDVNGDTMVNGVFRVYPGDGTLAIYSTTSRYTEYGVEGIAILTTFDGEDPISSTYPSLYPDRGVLQLQPRGGNIAIGLATATSYKLEINGSVYASSWIRTGGTAGWYSESYGGGLYMSDTSWIRTYGSKNFFCDGIIYAGNCLQTSCGTFLRFIQYTNEDVMGFGWDSTYGDYVWHKIPGTNNQSTFMRLCLAGGLYIWGNGVAYHFYEHSDIRYKNILDNINISVQQLAELPLFNFTWTDRDNGLHTGSSALAVQELLPNLVSADGEKLTLDYGVLGTVAGITACRELTKQEVEIQNLKDKIQILEKEIETLKNKN